MAQVARARAPGRWRDEERHASRFQTQQPASPAHARFRRDEEEAEAVLARLRPGEISREPVMLAAAFGIVKRVAPHPASAPELLLELPAPSKSDLTYLI